MTKSLCLFPSQHFQVDVQNTLCLFPSQHFHVDVQNTLVLILDPVTSSTFTKLVVLELASTIP